MRWKGARQSANVEDRRQLGGRRMAIGGGLGGVVFIIIALMFGADPAALLRDVSGPGGLGDDGRSLPQGSVDPADDEKAQFVATILATTEDAWSRIFQQMGKQYEEPNLVLFRGATDSSCGFADSAVGPFYCPGDSRVYLDLSFFDELERRFQAPGDFAQAYVIAHEIGHHVQNLLGIMDQVQQQRGRLSEKEYNALSVRLELQADFFAGVWAHHTNQSLGMLEDGDIEEGLRAASAIGDDKIQKRTQGYVVPDSFTHGSSDQRVRWFMKGFRSGDVNQGDTFSAAQP